MIWISLLLTLLSIFKRSSANTEKTIFLGPEPINVPDLKPSFENLDLITLNPQQSTVRLPLQRAFPNSSHPKGLSSWYLLSNLEKDRRYEVRICWAATEPTEFWLQEHTVDHVFDTSALISDLATFSEANNHDPRHFSASAQALKGVKVEGHQSLLFLHIHSAADYFTTNETLMTDPPPVLVDISQFRHSAGILRLR